MPQGDAQLISHTIDAAFTIHGNTIPLDHGYALYAALAGLPVTGPWLHASEVVAIHAIRGDYAGPGVLKLNRYSRLRLRLPAGELPVVLPLAGKSIEVNGSSLRISVPQTTLLQPAASLYAHCVTTRNGQDDARFDQEIARQLLMLAIQARATRGQRRVLRIKDKTVVGHRVLVTGLSAAESIHLQEAGLGGRRKMGCGVFIPWRG